MTIEVVCRCGKVMHAPSEYAGKRGRCKACGVTFQIPGLADDAVSVEPFTPAEYDVREPDHSPPRNPPPQDDYEDDVDYGDDVDEDLVAMVRRRTRWPADPPAVPSVPPPAPAPAVTSEVILEPWYYGFLSRLSEFVLVAGVVICLVMMFVGFIYITGGNGEKDSDGKVALGVYLMVTGGLSAFGTVFYTALVLLAVDVARNIRASRYGVK